MSGPEKKQDKKKEKKGEAGGEKRGLASRILPVTMFVTAVVFLPSTILLAACMIPTIVAALVDQNPEKTAGITVGAMNFAAVLPSWFLLFQKGHTIDTALGLALDPGVLAVSYLGAGIGWGIYKVVPTMVAGVLLGRKERRLREIDKRQKDLVRKWGEGIAAR